MEEDSTGRKPRIRPIADRQGVASSSYKSERANLHAVDEAFSHCLHFHVPKNYMCVLCIQISFWRSDKADTWSAYCGQAMRRDQCQLGLRRASSPTRRYAGDDGAGARKMNVCAGENRVGNCGRLQLASLAAYQPRCEGTKPSG